MWGQEVISKSKTKLKKYLSLLVSASTILLICVYFLTLNTQSLFPSLVYNREVLSQIVFSPDQLSKYQIIKVKIDNKIIVEIYKILNEYNFEFVSRIDTGSKYEGYFLLGGNATNLAYINIDDEPMKEIIVPGFDNNLTANLNVIKFDSDNKTFTLINQKIDPFSSKNL